MTATARVIEPVSREVARAALQALPRGGRSTIVGPFDRPGDSGSGLRPIRSQLGASEGGAQ